MKSVSVEELKKMMDQGEEFKLIDVREPHEYEFVNIGAELIPVSQVFDNTDKIPKDKKVVVMCRSGARSGQVIAALQSQLQYDKLYNLEGGILAWADRIDPSKPKY